MNEQDFYQTLVTQRNAHRAPAEISDRIDVAIEATNRRRHTQRRTLLMGFGFAALAIGLASYPSIKVYATMTKMKRAIEQVDEMRIKTEVVLLDGTTVPGPSIYIQGGTTAHVDAKGHLEGIQEKKTSWFWDPSLKVYVRRNARGFGMQSLSDMLQPSSPMGIGSGWTLDLIVVNGKQKLRAMVPHSHLNERYTFVADPATDLIESYIVDGKVAGKWTPRLKGSIEYGPNVAFPTLPKQARVLSEEELGAAQVRSIGATEIARKKVGKSTLVIRKIERTDSGCVFVVYQSGNKDALNDPRSSRWRGYATKLSDELGTNYVHIGQFMQLKQVDPKEPELGMFECEIFAPAEPLRSAKPRQFSIKAFEEENGKLARLTFGYSVFDDGSFKGYWIPQNAKPHSVLAAYEQVATQPRAPSWLSVFNVQPDDLESLVARFRARHFVEQQVWDRAEHYQLEAIRLTKEKEARTRMPHSTTNLESKLQHIREHSFKD